MRTFLDCVPCFIRQTLDASRLATDDEQIQESIMRSVLKKAYELPFSHSPPFMGREIHRIIRSLGNTSDPYRSIKDHSNREAMDLLPGLRERIDASPSPFETALRIAIAGNIIDFGVISNHSEISLVKVIEKTLVQPFAVTHVARLSEQLQEADRILYIADNAGEIVLDRLLLEQLPLEKTILSVRGAPIINDATVEDARFAGITDLVRVIDNGNDAPGTLLEQCSEEFLETFHSADLIIAKGQGNYETLSDCGKQGLFFLLKAKCIFIARSIGCQVGSIVVKSCC